MKSRNQRGFASFVLTACLWGLAAVQTHAQGTIVYHNPPDHSMISRGSPRLFHDVDLNGDGTVDFVFRADTSFSIYSTVGNKSIAIPQGGSDIGSFSIPLAEDYQIGPTLSEPNGWESSFQSTFSGLWIGQTLHRSDGIFTLGHWQPNMSGYLGVEFQIDGNTHYGWIGLSTWFLPINGGTIHDWAYNSMPNMPILAGQVPEPGTWALLTIGGSFLWWRHRKRPVPV